MRCSTWRLLQQEARDFRHVTLGLNCLQKVKTRPAPHNADSNQLQCLTLALLSCTDHPKLIIGCSIHFLQPFAADSKTEKACFFGHDPRAGYLELTSSCDQCPVKLSPAHQYKTTTIASSKQCSKRLLQLSRGVPRLAAGMAGSRMIRCTLERNGSLLTCRVNVHAAR